MTDFTPHTCKLFVEGIADNFMNFPHLRAFVETGSDSPSVLMTVNGVGEPHKVDFELAMGGARKDDGRKGVMVYMRWSETPSMGDAVTLTLWQQGAKSYGKAEPIAALDPAGPLALFEQGRVR